MVSRPLLGAVLATAALLAAIALSFADAPETPANEEPLTSAETGEAGTARAPETVVIQETQPASVAAQGFVLVLYEHRLLEQPPADMTAVLVEMVWENPPSVAGVGDITMVLGGGGRTLNATADEPEPGVVRAWVPASSYGTGELWASVYPDASDEHPNISAGAQLTFHVTAFFDQEIPWSWSALD